MSFVGGHTKWTEIRMSERVQICWRWRTSRSIVLYCGRSDGLDIRIREASVNIYGNVVNLSSCKRPQPHIASVPNPIFIAMRSSIWLTLNISQSPIKLFATAVDVQIYWSSTLTDMAKITCLGNPKDQDHIFFVTAIVDHNEDNFSNIFLTHIHRFRLAMHAYFQ